MNYKTILIILLGVLMPCIAHGQTEYQRLTISGQLLDADEKEPVLQATVQLFTVNDSTFVGGTVSDNKGNFSIEAPSNGTYRLKISSIGYQTIEREVTLRRDQNQELGSLRMSPESVMRKETIVTAQAPQVVVKKTRWYITLMPSVHLKALPLRSSSSVCLVLRWMRTAISPSMERR